MSSSEKKQVRFSDAQDEIEIPGRSSAVEIALEDGEDDPTDVFTAVEITNIEDRSHFSATRRLENLHPRSSKRKVDERKARLLKSHKPSGWFSLSDIRYRSFSEVGQNVTVLDTAWIHPPDGLARLNRTSWEAQLDIVIMHEGGDFQQRVDEKLGSREATVIESLEAVFETYVEIILEKVGSLNLALLWVLSTQQFNEFTREGLVTRLLAKGAKVTIAAKHSLDTPLHLVARVGSAIMVKHLLQHKAPIMAVNRQGKLPLEVAIAEENDEVAVMLIKHMEASVVRGLFQGSRKLPASLSFHALLENPNMQRTTEEVLEAMIEPLEGKEGYCVVHYSVLDSDECGRVPCDPLFNDEQKSPLHVIAQESKLELVSHDAVCLLLTRKWELFAKYTFGLKFIYHLVTLLALMTALTLAANTGDPRDYGSSVDGFRLFCEILAVVLTLLNGVSEINQMRIHKWDYLKDYKNYSDVTSVLSVLLIIPFRIAGLEVQWFFASISYLLTGLRAFEYAAVFRSTGAYVRIIVYILWRAMVPFLAIFFVLLVSFSGAMYFAHGGELYEDTPPSTSGYGCNSTGPNDMSTEPDELRLYDVVWIGVQVLILGDFIDPGNGEGQFSWLASVHYYIFLFIVVVVLLNLLIAHMSEIYASVQQHAQSSLALDRAQIIARIELNDPLSAARRKYYYESSQIVPSRRGGPVKTNQGLLEHGKAPPMDEVNNRLQKIEKAFKKQEENLEELRATFLENFNKMYEQLQELGQLQRRN